jgi:tocopherol cyclase
MHFAQTALTRLKTIWQPAAYHGFGHRAGYFEGWYFKIVDLTEQRRYAIIPGVFLGKDGVDSHSFVQTLDGASGATCYHRYPLEAFSAAPAAFDICVGPNRFTAQGIELNIDRSEQRLIGRLAFDGVTPWPVTWRSPGIMDWYSFVPFMECYHGVESLDHAVRGQLVIDDAAVDFHGGRGYIEKDWGKSFPAAYVWMQSNHFETPGTSFVGSIAIIPWLFSAFPGFIIGLLHDGRLHRFATYTRAATAHLAIDDDEVTWTVSNRRHRLAIRALRTDGGLLLGPSRERMGDRVGETMTSSIELEMTTIAGERVFAGTGRNAGLEVQGDLARLLALQRR